MTGAVNPNNLHSPPVCTMFNKIAQYLKFFMLFTSVTIMTSASKLGAISSVLDLNLGYTPGMHHGLLNRWPYMSNLKAKIKRPVQKNSTK